MLIKKFQGETEQEALQLAKDELGGDVIITHIKSIKPKGIYRLFKKKLDCTPREYIVARRMERAAELLRKTGLPIQVIARRLQFANQFYFSKCFKEHFNISPRAYRDSDSIPAVLRLRRESSPKQEIHGKKHWFYIPDSKDE